MKYPLMVLAKAIQMNNFIEKYLVECKVNGSNVHEYVGWRTTISRSSIAATNR